MNSNLYKELPFWRIVDYDISFEWQSCKNRIHKLLNNNRLDKLIQDNDLSSLVDSEKIISCSYYDEDKFNKSWQTRDKSLYIISLNIRSLPKHAGELINYLSMLKNDFQIIALTEIGSRYLSTVQHLMDDYTFHFVIPSTNKFGGVGLYVWNKLQNISVINELTLEKNVNA